MANKPKFRESKLKFDVIIFGMSLWEELKDFNTRSKQITLGLTKHPNIGQVLHMDLFCLSPRKTIKERAKEFFGFKEEKNKSFFRVEKISENVYSVSFSGELPVTFLTQDIEAAFLAHVAKEAAQKLNFSNNLILWLYNPVAARCIRRMNARMVIFDAVDDWLEHPGFVHLYNKERISKGYKEIIKRAKIIFTVSKELERSFSAKHPKVYHLPNAVDAKFLREGAGRTGGFPEDLAGLKQPLVGYVGTIETRIDLSLVRHLAVRNPDISFVMVGPVTPDVDLSPFSNLKNVHFLGKKSHQDVPRYINTFEVCFVPHKTGGLTKSMNPLKILEYLALGKPVVSTNIAGIEELANVVKIASDYDQFNRHMLSAIYEDKPDDAMRRQQAVERRTWDKVVNRMMEIIISEAQILGDK